MTKIITDVAAGNQSDVSRTDPVNGTTELTNRRRPGRKDVSPELIPLLRTPTQGSPNDVGMTVEEADFVSDPDDDAGRPARGILFAILLSLPIWSVIAVLVTWMRR
jgi:hypothetical protein